MEEQAKHEEAVEKEKYDFESAKLKGLHTKRDEGKKKELMKAIKQYEILR